MGCTGEPGRREQDWVESIGWSGARRGTTVVVIELIALAITAYAGFAAFVLLPPGMGGGSQDATGLAIAGVVALVCSIVLPSAGFLCGAFFWHDRLWLYRAAGACGVMVVVWLFLLVARVGS
jgi:hypothetical protein